MKNNYEYQDARQPRSQESEVLERERKKTNDRMSQDQTGGGGGGEPGGFILKDWAKYSND